MQTSSRLSVHTTMRCGVLAALLCGTALVPAAGASPAYTNFIVRDSQSTAVRAINNSGDVTGEFYTESQKHPDRAVGFLRKANGKIKIIDHQNAAQFNPKSINDSGDIYVAECGTHAVLVFAPDAKGNVAPILSFAGGLDYGIALRP